MFRSTVGVLGAAATTLLACGRLFSPSEGGRLQVYVAAVYDQNSNGFSYHHGQATTDKAVQTIQELSTGSPGFTVHASTSDSELATLSPNHYDVLVLPVCPWRLMQPQRDAIKAFVLAGKAFVGIHCAADTVNTAAGGEGVTQADLAWYVQNLLGGLTWASFPWMTEGVTAAETRHPSTRPMPGYWGGNSSPNFGEELYDFGDIGANRFHILMTVDPTSGQSTLASQPTSICRKSIAGGTGRSLLTTMGHSFGSYDYPWWREHLRQGIVWAGKAVAELAGGCADDNPALHH